MSRNTSIRVGQSATALGILSLFNYPLNEAACLPVSTVYSPIPLKASTHFASTRLVTLKNYQLNAGCRGDKLPNEHNSFSK